MLCVVAHIGDRSVTSGITSQSEGASRTVRAARNSPAAAYFELSCSRCARPSSTAPQTRRQIQAKTAMTETDGRNDQDGAVHTFCVPGANGSPGAGHAGGCRASGHALAYAKGWETIETVLGAVGAADAVLALEERSIVATARSEANRLANADHANLVRASRAARVQLEALRRLRSDGTLEQLDDRLREAAALRLRNPTLSLRELAARADPPATKAGMQRRLARLVALAED